VTQFWKPTPDGVSIMVKVQPKSRRPGVLGIAPSAQGPRLRLGVAEAAEGGRANQAVIALVSDLLSVPTRAVTIAVGESSREKLVRVSGSAEAITPVLAAL
jgi:uncharacterized protein YggU (UPF0235/DUF167 family)